LPALLEDRNSDLIILDFKGVPAPVSSFCHSSYGKSISDCQAYSEIVGSSSMKL
jgi:hypothetical protein